MRRIRPCTLIYLLLVGLTLLSWMVGAAGLHGLGASLLVLGVALIKGQLVGDWFMGLRRVRGPWRWAVAIWLFVPGVLVGTAFTLAAGGA
jgi:hypothetical protein